MKIKAIYSYFLLLVCLINQSTCSEKVPQIKVVGAQISSLNKEYSTKMVFTVNRFNKTFNYLKLFWEIKKDAPADLKVYTKVYVTTTTYQKGTLVLDIVTPVCVPSENRRLLHNIFQVHERDLYTQCIREGIYVLENVMQFRYEVLVPDIERKGLFYRADYKVGNADTVISKFTVYSEWGYHSTM